MTDLFVGLIFGFCAWIDDPGQTLLFGYRSQDKCVSIAELEGDNPHDTRFVADGHTITWQWFDDYAEIAIDGQKFVISRIISA